MNESPETTGCDGMAVRPIIPMRTPAGKVEAAFVVANDRADYKVEIWCQSPTGDQSDSVIFHLPCRTLEQAEFVADLWQKAWGLGAHDASVPAHRENDHLIPMA